MSPHVGRRLGISLLAIAWQAAPAAPSPAADPRLREVVYDAASVVTVPVKRGVVTLIVLDPLESIAEVASGLGADCSKPESAWCIASQAGGHTLFVKPKSSASASNNLAVVTDLRSHAFRFVILADDDPKMPVYRLTVRAPSPAASTARVGSADRQRDLNRLGLPALPTLPGRSELVASRLQATPEVRNSSYSIAEGHASDDIVPTLVFDDGRFTYFRFPEQFEVPAVFHVLGDGSEALVNTRMEHDLLVVDRVSRRLMLRAGSAVVGVWNEAFDVDGPAPLRGMTVPGVARDLKGAAAPATPMPTRHKEHLHE